MDEYTATARKLNSGLESLIQQKTTVKNQIVRTLTPAEPFQLGLLVLTPDHIGDPPFQNHFRRILPRSNVFSHDRHPDLRG